jgi:Lsr2
MSFNRLLADAPPAKAARAALVMARATVDEPGVPAETQRIARQLIDLGVEELTERIRARRAEVVADDLLSLLRAAEAEAESVSASEDPDAADLPADDTEDEVAHWFAVETEPSGQAADEAPEGSPQTSGRRHRAAYSFLEAKGYGRSRAAIDREQAEAIREWARRNGVRVSTRSRIPADVVAQFIAANTSGS